MYIGWLLESVKNNLEFSFVFAVISTATESNTGLRGFRAGTDAEVIEECCVPACSTFLNI